MKPIDRIDRARNEPGRALCSLAILAGGALALLAACDAPSSDPPQVQAKPVAPAIAPTPIQPPATISTAAREIRFPEEREIGTLKIRVWKGTNDVTTSHDLFFRPMHPWQDFGPARGTVTIPAGKVVLLEILNREAADLSPLLDLKYDDLLEVRIRSNATDYDLSTLGALALRRLDMRFTRLVDEDLAYFESMDALRSLHLAGTLVGDDGLTHLAGLTNLVLLDLNRTKVTDKGLAHLEGLSALRLLDLRDTQVTEIGKRRFQDKLPECRILFNFPFRPRRLRAEKNPLS